MDDVNDLELLRDYDRQGSEAAFATLVARHINLVYSVAFRHTGNAAHAEEITQAVFVILARKAAGLRPDTVLEGWLYQTTRLTALSFLRGERRRQLREQEAYMQSTLVDSADISIWNQLAPLLDDAMAQLRAQERDAIVLRYFQNKSLRDVGAVLGVDEFAAQKRISRALEKLRKVFAGKGAVSTAETIAGVISANYLQAAPLPLAKSVTVIAVAKGAAAGGSTLILIKGALKLMAWTQAKTAILVSAGVLLAAGTATVAVVQIEKPPAPVAVAEGDQPSAYPWQLFPGNSINGQVLEQAPPLMEIRPTVSTNGGGGEATQGSGDEIMRLGMGYSIQTMLMSAWGFSWSWAGARTVVAAELPADHYDYIDSLPQGATQAFKDAIKKKFGFTGRVVAIETNVLLLQVKNPNAPGLKPGVPGSVNRNWQSSGEYSLEYHIADSSFTNLVNYCENTLKIPVVDRTGLTGKYDADIKCEWGKGRSEADAFKQAVLDQLGQEFVPARETIDVLVIERAKN